MYVCKKEKYNQPSKQGSHSVIDRYHNNFILLDSKLSTIEENIAVQHTSKCRFIVVVNLLAFVLRLSGKLPVNIFAYDPIKYSAYKN